MRKEEGGGGGEGRKGERGGSWREVAGVNGRGLMLESQLSEVGLQHRDASHPLIRHVLNFQHSAR